MTIHTNGLQNQHRHSGVGLQEKHIDRLKKSGEYFEYGLVSLLDRLLEQKRSTYVDHNLSSI